KAFCVEISEGYPSDPITYTMVAPTNVPEETPPGNMTANQSQMMQDLYSRYYADVIDYTNDASWAATSDEAAAFQLVIWEISHENFSDTSNLATMKSELDITLGAMVVTNYYSNDVLNAANAMIAALGSGGYNNFASMLGATNATNQDLLIVVPTPAIAGLAGLGLVGMRRRRR
ncbi:MAG: Cys-Gln thioester bond-forming surface protein, partial [Planctomycetota bacterium]|nr:Cys-Gln thioester bond-forming surface protein [Planctomycetota bacterium]